MTDTELGNILTSLGYKDSGNDKWLKPVGKSLLSFETETNLWTNGIIESDGAFFSLDSHKYDEEAWIKSREHFDYWWECGNPDMSPLHTFIAYREAYADYSTGKGGDFRV